jgi:hypothetical protein
MPFTVPREAPVCYPPTSQNRAVIAHGQGSWARLQYRRLSAHYNAPRCKSQDLPPDEGYAFRAPSQGCNQSACAAAVAIKLNAALHPNLPERLHVRGC